MRLCELDELSQIRRPGAEAGFDSLTSVPSSSPGGWGMNVWFLLTYACGKAWFLGAANVVLALVAVPAEFLMLGTSLSSSWDISSAME